MRVFVTGGAGYIGSHVARELIRQGNEVVVFDNLSTGYERLANGCEFIWGDLRDGLRLISALGGADAVMHLAAHAYVGESVENPRKYFDNNGQAGLNLLNAVLDARIPYFVFSSSCAVYGIPDRFPITEDSLRLPVSPYGASKLFLEHALEAYDRAYGLRSVSLRYFNAAGADESGQIGELHDPETHLIPLALRAAADPGSELPIYGNDYPTHDGTCVRDYIHVNDIAVAHILALEYLVRGEESTALNLGTGTGNSVNEVVSAIESVTGRTVRRRYCARRPGDPPLLIADASQAKRLLGWQPSRSLQEIVSSAWHWFRQSQALIGSPAGPARGDPHR